MKKLLIASATALAVAFAGMPAMAASSSPTAPYQVAQAKSDPAPAKKGKKKAATKKAEGGEKAKKKAKGKKKTT